MVRREVDGAPESEAVAAESSCGVVEEIDERAPVEEESGVTAHPDLQTAELAGVAAPQSKADQIVIVVHSDNSTLEVRFVVRRFW